MSRNDPDNLRLNEAGLAVLTCDWCGEEFEREVRYALDHLRRNEEHAIYCGQSCAARAANAKRPRRKSSTAHGRTCRLDPGARECPFVRTPPLQMADLRRSVFQPQSDIEIDLCIEHTRAAMALAKNAPPEEREWAPEARDDWHEANGTHDLTRRLLDREVSRRKATP